MRPVFIITILKIQAGPNPVREMYIAKTLRGGGGRHHTSSFSKSQEPYSVWCVFLKIDSPGVAFYYILGGAYVGRSNPACFGFHNMFTMY